MAPTRSADKKPIVALVIGKTGNGKSSLCNTILGEARFETGRSMSSTTLQMQAALTNSDGDQIEVVDTPDVTNLDWTKQEMQQEVQKWKDTIRKSPYIVLLAVRCDVRYTAEEYAVYQQVCKLLGDSFVKSRLVVAFTFGDRQDGDIGEELKTVCPEMKSVLRDAGERYVVFNNKAEEGDKAEMVRKLLEKVQTMNYSSLHYSSGDTGPNKMGETMMTLLVVGKTGNAKSALGNTILGRNEFPTGRSMSSTTLKAQEAISQIRGRTVKVVDTPDVSNLDMTQQQTNDEVARWKSLTAPHPTAILLAVRCDVRYTAEEYAVYQQVCQLLGDNVVKSRLVVAFTFGDRQDGDIGEELKTVCQELQNVLKDAGDRYVVFNNKASERDKAEMVGILMEIVQTIQPVKPQPSVFWSVARWLLWVLCGNVVLWSSFRIRAERLLIPIYLPYIYYWFDLSTCCTRNFPRLINAFNYTPQFQSDSFQCL